MVFVRCACAAVDAENRLRGGCLPLADPWRFPPTHVAATPFSTTNGLSYDSSYFTCCFFAIQTYCTTFINRAYFKKA